MKKKIISSLLVTLIIAVSSSLSVFAAMSNGTVVIGDKAFDLAYANSTGNLTEITNLIVQGGTIYVKDFSGIWIDNITGKPVNASVIPALVYKNVSGVTNFDPADKDQVAKLPVKAGEGVYYVPADILGKSQLTDDELRKIKGNAEEMKKQIKTVADLINYLRVNQYTPDERGDNKIYEGNYEWHHNRPSWSTIKLNTGNCGATASFANYILQGKYDEAGFITFSEEQGGHVYNYVIQDGKVYIIDFLQYLEGNPSHYNRETIIEVIDSFEQYANSYINRYRKGIKFFVKYTADEVLPIANNFDRKMMYYQKGSNVTSFYETPEADFILKFIDPPTKFPNWD